MNLQPGKKYKFRILEEGNYFYPQIYIDSFWHNGWYYLDKENHEDIVATIKRGDTKVHNKNIESADGLIAELKSKFQVPKIHNEREEQF